jgi:thiol:disulfide interchange protein/DsbC/DsbD-like thiol-disulfide interchange protein
MMMFYRIFFCLVMLFAAASAHAQLPAEPNVPAVLRAETNAPAPGQNLTVAFVMTPKPGWHGYFENPGDAGFGMQLEWDLPEGVTAGKPRYPVPETLMISGLMNYVYERPYAVLVDIKLAPNIAGGANLPIKVRADWLACTDKICVPEGDDLAINLIAGQGQVTATGRTQFDAYRAAIPVPLDQEGRYAVNGKTIEIAIPYPKNAEVNQPYFFALTPDVIDYPMPQTARRVGDMLIITAGMKGETSGTLSGVFRYGEGQGLIINAREGSVPAGGVSIAQSEPAGENKKAETSVNLALILGFSVLGGLILNVMPCVFPVLGLKAVALTKMGGDARAAKRDALAYTAGVILSVVALGGIMLVLRGAGQQVGWAFQLQEPRIVLLLLLLMSAVTLNLAGAFEVATVSGGNSLARKQGLAGSFWTGVLAAVVATPCTGPFMAAATGAALLLPAPLALLIFAGLGFGLALPYLAIAYIPFFRTWLPKPGPWLGKFKTAMVVPMALTAIALAWLLWRMSGAYGLTLGLVAVTLLSALLFALGGKQKRGQGGMVFAGIAIAVAAASMIILPRDAIAVQSGADNLLAAKDYNEEKLAEYRKSGSPVFVYFTADWCVSCKVNETAAINIASTAAAFEKSDVKVLRGDFTRRDPALSRALAQHGRSGVPLYLYYPRGGDAKILPQILTPQMLIDLPKKTGTGT